MKKINLKQGKYILPLIFLPFFFLGFYLYQNFTNKKAPEVVVKNDINSDLAPPSPSVTNTKLSNKLDEYKKNYRQSDGYTAITGLQEEETQNRHAESLYSDDEKRTLDSLEDALKESRNTLANGSGRNGGFKPRSQNLSDNDKMLLGLLNQQKEQPPRESEPQVDPTEMMKKQFQLLDSFEKANDPKHQEKLAEQERQKEIQNELARIEASRFTVQKASMTKGFFNTLKPENSESFIKAIIDENVTAYAGSRIRIKLMEDIMVGKQIVQKGTYLYATINGFTQQRITLNVSSIMKGNKIMPINLDIYDTDGMIGLYVPASAFREFTKRLGSSSMQGMNISTSSTEDQSQFLMSTMQKAFQSTSQAIAKAIRQNKAKLKYSTFIYLIDSQELKKQLNSNEKED
ncbi:MAG: conjugative transposon protein TraM [Olivibacter sp.]|nr:conjugative transposon protein TraM [Olivibacter sp. UJ_SKK_5.1]